MAHSHRHADSHADVHAHDSRSNSLSNVRLAFYFNFGLVILEVVGGIYAQSLAILSNAVHDLGDCISLGSAFYLEKLAHRPRDSKFNYGYKRFSLLSALITGFVVLLGTLLILIEAISHINNPSAANGKAMLVFAAVGISINFLAWMRLRSGRTQNEKILMLHFIEDTLGWAAILVGSTILYYTGWLWLDSVLAIGLSVFTIVNAVRSLRSTIYYFLQGFPNNLDSANLMKEFSQVEGVAKIIFFRAWSLDGHHSVANLSVNLKAHASTVSAAQKLRAIAKKYSIEELHIGIDDETNGGAHENH